MSETGGNQLLTRRSSFRKSLAEAALPEEYLGQLEEKRKQLDESIHKYIAAKERDYKNFEKELRNQHRVAQGQDGPNGSVRRRSSRDAVQGDGKVGGGSVAADAPEASTTRSGSQSSGSSDESATQLDRSTLAGLQDRRASVERDKDFVGLFTPAFLPAIDDRDGRDLERTTSAPTVVPTLSSLGLTDGHVAQHERSNSDTMVQAKAKRPSQLAIAHRTSSSGSSADGKLASAMKSSSQQPKRKRVSLAVGDTIVAPSDNVPAVPSNSNTPSHSRQRGSGSRREFTPLSKETTQSSVDAAVSGGVSQLTDGQSPATPPTDTISIRAPVTLPPAIAASNPSRKITPQPTGKLDPDGDLFDLEAVEEVPIQPADYDDFEDAVESDDDDTDTADPVNPTADLDLPPADVRYDPTTGLIAEPSDGTDSAVPYLAFGPSSAVASQQPTRPGFRRPSVIDDPIYRGPDYRHAERDAVENEIYGSSFNRPGSKGSFTAGSLGESYMAAHAAEMERSRGARSRAEVGP